MNLFTTSLITMIMTYGMPKLPYASHALEPVISQETIEYHYGKHLQTYVNNLNSLVIDSPFDGMKLEEIVATAPEGPIFNNAGQVLNHILYFLQFSPYSSTNAPTKTIEKIIKRDFGNFENFKDEMTQAATSLFGSGWVWLVIDENGKMSIVKEPNGSNPIRHGLRPLLGFDVWEHAYYLDYQNRRTDHLANLWKIINWQVVEDRI